MNKVSINGESISLSLSLISEQIIEEAYTSHGKMGHFPVWFTKTLKPAVSFMTIIAVLFSFFLFTNSNYITGKGILVVQAYALNAESVDDMIESKLIEGIELPYEYGWSPTSSIVPGLPLKFSVPEYSNVTMLITVDGGQFILWKRTDSIREAMVLGQNFSINNEETIYWQNYTINNNEVFLYENDTAYAYVTIYSDENIIGYAVIEISTTSSPCTVPRYFAKIIQSVSYPLQNGVYQNITQDYINEQFNTAKNNRYYQK